MRRALIASLLLLAACGAEDTAPEKTSLIQRRVLTADIWRGATLVLYGDQRCELYLMHLGGGTTGLGTWARDAKQIRVSIPRTQEHVTRGFEPVVVHAPAWALTLEALPSGSWREVRRTFATDVPQGRAWTESYEDALPRRTVDRSYRFWTEADWERFMVRIK